MTKEQSISLLRDNSLYEGTYLEFLGFRLTAWRNGFARIEMPVRPEQRNTIGYLHGGVISSLLDIVGGVAGSYGIADDYVSITVNINCNFMAPHQAKKAVAEGELVRKTGSLFFATAKLYDQQQKQLFAQATAPHQTPPR